MIADDNLDFAGEVTTNELPDTPDNTETLAKEIPVILKDLPTLDETSIEKALRKASTIDFLLTREYCLREDLPFCPFELEAGNYVVLPKETAKKLEEQRRAQQKNKRMEEDTSNYQHKRL